MAQAPEVEFDDEEFEDDAFEDDAFEDDEFDDGFEDEERPPSAEDFDAPTNPLRSPSDQLDRLLDSRINDDLWAEMLGELPCADMSESCLATLQQEAIANSPILAEIDLRIEEVELAIDEARASNQRLVVLERLSPVLRYYLTTDSPISAAELARARSDYDFDRRQFERGQDLRETLNPQTDPTIRRLQREEFRPYREPLSPLARLAGDLLNPGRLLNNVLNLMGIPLLEGLFGGSPAAQSRAIAIGDLQIKLAQMQRDRAAVASEVRDKVVELVLDLDSTAREFQIAQEIGRRDAQRLEILRISYRYAAPGIDTQSYLRQLSEHDRQRSQVLRAWTQLRVRLLKLRVLVTGNLELMP